MTVPSRVRFEKSSLSPVGASPANSGAAEAATAGSAGPPGAALAVGNGGGLTAARAGAPLGPALALAVVLTASGAASALEPSFEPTIRLPRHTTISAETSCHR